MKRVLVVFGTRPEVIKMAPVVFALQSSPRFDVVTCATAQHRELLDQLLRYFALTPDIDLNVMRPGQDLTSITVHCLDALRPLLKEVAPDLVLVQGDTTTTLATALAAFYAKIPVGHIEAGLRTYDRYSPFPEEMNRKLVTSLAHYHFAPTDLSAQALRREGVAPETIHVTGNTSIDALKWCSRRQESYPQLASLWQNRTPVLLTVHRRENFGERLVSILETVREFAQGHPAFHWIFPVHPNPQVKAIAYERLEGIPNVSLIPPLSYGELVFVLRQCQWVMTDSGGLQEEAPALGKPVLVLRDHTERPEAVTAGAARLVGHERRRLLEALDQMIAPGSPLYEALRQVGSPFGDGKAAERIRDILQD